MAAASMGTATCLVACARPSVDSWTPSLQQPPSFSRIRRRRTGEIVRPAPGLPRRDSTRCPARRRRQFLQPAAGTSAIDHLASGLVPLALLALGGWIPSGAGRRTRPDHSRPESSGSIGVLEAGYYSVAIGPSGDDYTGLLAIPAGLVLVGVGFGAVALRRQTPRLWWRYSRRHCCSAWWASLRFTRSSSPSVCPTCRPTWRAPSYQTPTSVRMRTSLVDDGLSPAGLVRRL